MGTTHVSINFTDLTSLFFSLISNSTNVDYKNPLIWIGYEASAYAVAKGLVVTEMLKNSSAFDQILQVCYSSVWSRTTVTVFRSSLSSVVSQFQNIKKNFYSDGVDSALVLALLKRWQITDVSLGYAFNMWVNDSTLYFSDVANWLDYNDREALTKYKLTGQLLPGNVGSITMFASLKSNPKRAICENFLNAIPIDLLQEAREHSSDIVSAAISVLRLHISSLMKLIHSQKLTISIRLGQVDLHDALQKSIKTLNPFTVHWHCTPDFHDAKSFHEIATKCSGNDTVHSMTSTRWHSRIKGASIIDYANSKDRIKILSLSKKTLDKLIKRMPNFQKRLLDPIIVNPFVTSDYVISSTFVTRFINSWKCKSKIGSTHYFFFNLFGDSGAIHVVWTYNNNIDFLIKES
jgi:hypothetical protein